VAVEADGPSHVSRTRRLALATPPRAVVGPPAPGAPAAAHRRWRAARAVPLGATLLKRRHLRALGWAVVNVGHDEWEAVTVAAAANAGASAAAGSSDSAVLPPEAAWLWRRVEAAERERDAALSGAAAKK
jgi:hypothetical protein